MADDERLTFNAHSRAAAHAACIILSLTGVNSIIIKAGGGQFQHCHRVNKGCAAVGPVCDLGVMFVPGHFQRGCAADFTLQSEWLTPLYKLSGREFQHKLRWFWEAKTQTC